MFGRKLKDDFIKKEYYLTNVETNVIEYKIFRSKHDLIQVLFAVFFLSGLYSSLFYDNVLYNLFFGMFGALFFLFLSTEKDDSK